MVLPVIQVLHLPSSVSFYSAILQPLGLYYLDSHIDNTEAVTFGTVSSDEDQNPALQILQTKKPFSPLRLSSIVLTAPSHAAVSAFHDCSLRANPSLQSYELQPSHNPDPQSYLYPPSDDSYAPHTRPEFPISRHRSSHIQRPGHSRAEPFVGNPFAASSTPEELPYGVEKDRNLAWFGTDENGNICSIVRDLDGNKIKVIYSGRRNKISRSPPSSPPAGFWPSTTQIPPAGKSLPFGVANSTSNPFQKTNMSHRSSAATPLQSSTSGGLNASTVVGAILGVAAGAAFTYGALSRDKEPEPYHHELPSRSRPPPSGPVRRATFQDSDRRSRYSDRTSLVDDYIPRRVVDDSHSHGIHYADVVDDYEYAWPPPHYLTQTKHRSHVPSSFSKAKSRSRAGDEDFDRRSRPPVSNTGVRQPSRASGRSRSETPMERVPFETDRRSQAQTQYGYDKPIYGFGRFPAPPTEVDMDSFYSARSHRTRGTSRPPPSESRPPPVKRYEVSHRGRSESRASTSRGSDVDRRVSRRQRSESRGPSLVSAKGIPLPMSGVGSSHAAWDDDLASIAPSDSISCVGSKSGHRSRRHR